MTATAEPAGPDSTQPPAVDLAHLPPALLEPLLEGAADALRAFPPADLPPSARRLAGFGRKGLATPAARGQLLRLLDGHRPFQAAVIEAFLARPDVAARLGAWPGPDGRREAVVAAVAGAAVDGSLGLMTSILVCGRPPGWEFGLGLAVGSWAAEQGAGPLVEQMGRLEERLAGVEEARRRAEAARDAAVERAKTLDAELRQERQARRAREAGGNAEADAARRQVGALGAEVKAAQGKVAEAGARAGREADRARTAEARLKEAQAEVEAARRAIRADEAQRAALAALWADAARLGEQLSELAWPPPAPATTEARPPKERRPPPAAARRVPVQIPKGMRDDTPKAVEAMLGTPRLVVIVDGYNVSKEAWPTARPAELRDRLCAALAQLHLRLRCAVTVVFDGAEVEGVRPARRPGVTVLFSAAGQEADEVVVEQVVDRPPSVPVLVVTSDTAVGAGAEHFGAQVVPAALFLQLLRR